MLYNYFGNQYAINCDWLQFSVRLGVADPDDLKLKCPDGFRLELLQGNNVYKNRFILYDAEGRKWLTALWLPYSSVLDKAIMTVQAANWLLYSDLNSCIMDLLNSIVDCSFNNMGRIDLCCDFVASAEQLETLRHLNSGHYYVQGKSEGSRWWHNTEGKKDGFIKQLTHCQSWGKHSSEIKWKVYYKSREIGCLPGWDESECEKPWIRDEWKCGGMDIYNVWRCEVSMSGASCLRYDDKMISLSDALSGCWQSLVFSDMLQSRFVIRVNQGRRDGHKNKDKIVPFLPMQPDKIHLSWTKPRDNKKPGEGILLLRKMMGLLDNPVCKVSEEVYWSMASAVRDVVEAQHLEEYFEKKFGMETDVYFEKLSESIGMGCVKGVAAPSQSFT